MIRKKTLSIFIVITLLLLGSTIGLYIVTFNKDPYVPSVKGEPVAIDTHATSESVSSLTDAINIFSCSLFEKLCNEREGNHFFSPYSVFVALSMTYEGAKNATADELHDMLRFPQNNDTMLCSFGRIYNLLNQKKQYTLNTANALWVKHNYPFLPSYLDFIEHYYMGKATEVDFNDPLTSSQLINDWVSEQTNGKITDLVTADSIDPLTALILTNAIYFKGTWVYEFDPDLTTDAEFRLPSDEIITVPMMHTSKEISCNYTENEDVQILELPYKGDKVSMIVILPKRNDITVAERMITPTTLSMFIHNLHDRSVDVSMPKFLFKTEYSLKNTLIDLGLNVSFTPYADFSGMTGQKDLCIDKVVHKAFIEVNEEGTEAAAATSVQMVLTSIPETTRFTADHPFVFLLYHKETGMILFMGRVIDPSS
jgi:serpin B